MHAARTIVGQGGLCQATAVSMMKSGPAGPPKAACGDRKPNACRARGQSTLPPVGPHRVRENIYA